MDATDVKIFCEMTFKSSLYSTFANRHVSPSTIGKKLGLAEKTVRARIGDMEERGFIKYYQGVPNLAQFGFKRAISYRFEALNIATKFSILEELHTTLGLVEARDYLGPVISLELTGESSQQARKLAGAIALRFELKRYELLQSEPKEPSLHPDRLDWKIVQKLRYDARRPTRDVARELSITRRMAEYRIEKLLRSGALSIRPLIDPQKQEGLIFYEMECSVAEEKQTAVMKHVRETYGEKLWAVNPLAHELLLLNLFCFSLREPEEAATNLLSLEGVKMCSLFILKEIIEPKRPNWIDKLIEERSGSRIDG